MPLRGETRRIAAAFQVDSAKRHNIAVLLQMNSAVSWSPGIISEWKAGVRWPAEITVMPLRGETRPSHPREDDSPTKGGVKGR